MLFSVGLSICGMDIQMRCGHLSVVVYSREYMYIYQLNICELVNKGTHYTHNTFRDFFFETDHFQ